MTTRLVRVFESAVLALIVLPASAAAQEQGLKMIRAADMKPHLEFLAAREFEGRAAPSTALSIASLYLAREARARGLRPLMPDGSFFQNVPVEVTTISPALSRLRLLTPGGEETFFFPRAFVAGIRGAQEGPAAGGLVFIGASGGPGDPIGSQALAELPFDLKGRMAVVLAAPSRSPAPPASPSAAFSWPRLLREKGAAGMITIIAPEREKALAEKGLIFDIGERLRFPSVVTSIPGSAPASSGPAPAAPFAQIEVRHATGAALLGVGLDQLNAWFDAAAQGRAVPPRALDGRRLEISIVFETRRTTTPNVLGWVEGRDPRLKSEYVVISAHHDHNPMREGRVFPGADDDGSGTAALLELVEAVVKEPPRRSVIFIWNTAEERGLIGSYHFVQNCPVPVGSISANLNLDMLARNDPGMIHLIGSRALASGLDRSIREMNDRSVRLKLDYTYESPAHPDRFFYRSDQYPYIRYGIPGVWFFCGTTPDYHQETDTVERCDFGKMERVAKLAYLTCLDIGNKPALLELDGNPEVTERGPRNMIIDWPRLPPPGKK